MRHVAVGQLIPAWDVVNSFPFGGGTLLGLLFLLLIFTKNIGTWLFL